MDEQENGSMNSGCERQELHPCGPKWVTATASLLPQPSCSPHQWPRRHTRAHPLPAHFCMPIATTTHPPCALTRKPDTGTHNPPASTSYTHAPSPTPTTTREPSSTPTARTAHPHTTHNNTHTHSWVSQCVALRNELVDDVEGRVHDKLVGARRDVVPLLLEHALEDRLLRACERRRKRKWEARNEEERGAGV